MQNQGKKRSNGGGKRWDDIWVSSENSSFWCTLSGLSFLHVSSHRHTWRHPSHPQGSLSSFNFPILILALFELEPLCWHVSMQAHSSASNNNNNRLELRFRHDDPYSHPAFGDLRPCNSFLLKISKSKSSESDLLAAKLTPETDQVNVCADIVARVPEAYHFDG